MAQLRRSRKIRLKQSLDVELTFLNQDGLLTRSQAIERIYTLLLESCNDTEAQRLIGLFNITPEELAEAGLSYEVLKVLERLAAFI